jgi:hypothetical protein
MDDLLVTQLIKQLKILNFWIRLFGILVLVSLVILGVLLYKIVTFVNDTQQKIIDIQQKTSQTLDVQQRLCDTKTGNVLLQKTDVCNDN